MVLHPLDGPPSTANAPSAAPRTLPHSSSPPPAWQAVAERQKQRASAYWLISQPDHGRLSGELAANFVSPKFPPVNAVIARAIGVHDVGWGLFESEAMPTEPPLLTGEGKPLSFLEFHPPEFVRAWTASIDRAEGICPAGGIIVSRHFWELGDFRLRNGSLAEADCQLIGDFQRREQARQQRLLRQCPYSQQELDAWLEVLKFCDLLSLYLCSGAEYEVEFPQRLAERPVRVCRCMEDEYRFDPSPFQGGTEPRLVSLGVTARYFPSNGDPKLTTLEFLLA